MKLYVNEKLFSIHRKFYVKDINDEDVFEISSKIVSIGAKTTINDISGNKLAYIEQDIFHIMPSYDIYINDELVCEISKKIKLFRNNYVLNNGYTVDGNFLMLDFSIFDDNDKQIGSVKRKLLSIGDKYEIDIPNKKNTLIVLAIVVAIANDVNRSQAINNSD
ncbi:MAG: LURP-one-related/scramblase family protein [Bacilli bacterium]